MSNADHVAAMYAAFGRGDIPAILERLAPDVIWDAPQQATDAPWLQARHGRQGAGEFFSSLAAIEFHRFDVKAILEGGDGLVIGMVDVGATVKATGITVDEPDEVHIWRFNDQGLATHFRHKVDTRQHDIAFRGR